MKKWSFVLVAVLNLSVAHANEPVAGGALSGKISLVDGNGYFILSDGTCWKAVPFFKRWRSLKEWWSGVQLPVPQNYECAPKDWFLGAQVEAYSKYDNLNVNEADASNQHILKQCSHLLVNRGNGQILFAIALDPASCMVDAFNQGRTEGYNEGYSAGRLTAYQNANEVYQGGYNDGYQAGLRDGSQN